MTKFRNKSFSVGYKGEKVTDMEWEIATGSRCPDCTSRFHEGTTNCVNPHCQQSPSLTVEAPPVQTSGLCDQEEGYEEWGALKSRFDRHSGSTFDSFLFAHGIKEECEAVAIERVDGVAVGMFDGGSSENPGQGASAWALEYPDKTTVTDVKGIGIVSNNVAEYLALIGLLEYAIAHDVKKIRVYGDSLLIINQSSGKWKVKAGELQPLAATARKLVSQFEKCELTWIPREENTKCDALVKAKIREVKGK